MLDRQKMNWGLVMEIWEFGAKKKKEENDLSREGKACLIEAEKDANIGRAGFDALLLIR